MSADEKTLTKKLKISTLKRRKIAVDESRIIYTNIKTQVVTASSEYIVEKPLYFNAKKPGQVKDSSNVSAIDREKLRGQFNVKAASKWFLSPKIYYGRVIYMLQNQLVGYLEPTRGNLHVSQYYDGNVDKKILKFYNYIKTVHGENLIYFPRSMSVYKKT